MIAQHGLSGYLCRYLEVFSVVGITAALLVLLNFIRITFEGFRRFVLPLFHEGNVKRFGKWAVVTGSTDGIGKSYARQLAERKIDLVLISRNTNKLSTTANEIEKEFGVTVKTIQADFTQGRQVYQSIKEKLEGLEIGILVNNVGLMEPQPCYFLQLTEEEILDIINVNASSLLIMTGIVLPRMIDRKSGVVVNVCSLMSEYVTPLVSCYGACKCMVNSLSLALFWENMRSGVYVQTLSTSCVTTKLISFTKVWKYLRPFVTDADTYSRSALRMLAQTSHSTGYWGHSVQYFLTLTPKAFQKYLIYGVNLLFLRNKPT